VGPSSGSPQLILLFLVAQLGDRWIFHNFVFHAVYDRAWGRMLRLAGYFPLWTIAALALVLHDWVPRELSTLGRASRRGLLLFWSAALGGIIAELLKIVLRRERPGLTDPPRRRLPVCFPVHGSCGMRSPSDARPPGSSAVPTS
jgi:hypothetical protein